MSDADAAGVTFDESAGGLRVVIPAKRRPLVFLFEFYILLFMAALELIIIQSILTGDPPTAHWTGLVFGTFAGAFLIRRISWFLSGRLVIIAGARTLTLQETSFGVHRSWDYKKHKIRSLRVLPHVLVSEDTKALLIPYTLRSGRIAFNYETQIITFGEDIDEAGALQVHKRLKPYFPT